MLGYQFKNTRWQLNTYFQLEIKKQEKKKMITNENRKSEEEACHVGSIIMEV